MLQSTSKPRLTVRRRYSAADSGPWQREQTENLLATLVARAFAADHPELFGSRLENPTGDSLDEH